MIEPDDALEPAVSPGGSRLKAFLWRKLPYVAVLALAVFGVAYTNISHQALNGYWEFLAVAIGFVCVIAAWSKAPDKQTRIRLVWTQALHWITFLVTMTIVLLPTVQRMLTTPATSLVLLMLLALGTFLAGIHLFSLQICFLGLAMALSVPAIAWFKQSALFLLLAGITLGGLVMAFWPSKAKNGGV